MKHLIDSFFWGSTTCSRGAIKHHPLKQIGCIALSLVVAFAPLSTAFAQVVADPNAGQYRPGQTSAGNGVPVVNIPTPSNPYDAHTLDETLEQAGILCSTDRKPSPAIVDKGYRGARINGVL